MSRRRRWLRRLLPVVLLAAAAGHAVYWYLPREHPAVPDPSAPPGSLLGGDFDSALWLAYPHQNVAMLEKALGGPEEARDWLAALARLTELPSPQLPSFGPFALPPSRELLIGTRRGDGTVIAARVYPALAVLARLAGTVAGNPWLAGGEVEAGGGRLRVEWQGTLWSAASGGASAERTPATGRSGEAPGAALAVLRLGRPASWLPSATYRLHRAAAATPDLELATLGASALTLGALPQDTLTRLGVLAAVLNGRGGPLARQPGLLLILAREDGEGPGLPPAAVLTPASAPRDERLRLPAERVYSVLGGGLEHGEAAGWEILASDRRSLAAATELAPALDARPSGLSVELWLEPGRAHALAEGAAAILDSLPLMRSDDVQRWRDWATVLAPLEQFAHLHLVASETPPAFRLRLVSGGR